MSTFSHIDEKGSVRMVDVTDKGATLRIATAQAVIFMSPPTFELIQNQAVKKGNVLETARIAGIMAAKKTSDLIPLCHPLNLSHVNVSQGVNGFDFHNNFIFYQYNILCLYILMKGQLISKPYEYSFIISLDCPLPGRGPVGGGGSGDRFFRTPEKCHHRNR